MTKINYNYNGPLRVGIGGPVGSGKTTLLIELCREFKQNFEICAITNDIYTKEDAKILSRSGVLSNNRIMGVETGGCPHTAIREDASINISAIEKMNNRLKVNDILNSIKGDLGDYACEEMISGSIIVMGKIGNSFAKGIKRGTIITKEKKVTKDYRLSNNAEYNFISFFINKISKIVKSNLLGRKSFVSRYHGHKDNNNLSEVFIFKS